MIKKENTEEKTVEYRGSNVTPNAAVNYASQKSQGRDEFKRLSNTRDLKMQVVKNSVLFNLEQKELTPHPSRLSI